MTRCGWNLACGASLPKDMMSAAGWKNGLKWNSSFRRAEQWTSFCTFVEPPRWNRLSCTKAQGRNPRRCEELPHLFAPSQLHLCTCCVILHDFVILHCNSLLLTIPFPDTLTSEVHSAIQKLLLSLSPRVASDLVADLSDCVIGSRLFLVKSECIGVLFSAEHSSRADPLACGV